MAEITIKPEERAKLTLQQKLVKAREAIPRLQQKQYSEAVKYKFLKVSDIYEYLTPALNALGINFDIIAEEATRHAENGDPVFYHSYEQITRNGGRIIWVYESDITVRWTNADNPEDRLDVKVHALGCNDASPDKAKGSALTYCVKYLLFNKFSIDQGDDPDMNDYSSEAPQWQNRGQEPRNGYGRTNTPPQPQNGSGGRTGAQGGISDAQLARMYRKGEDAGYTREQVNDRIGRKYALGDPHLMTRAQYDETCAALDAAAKPEETGGQDNAE